MSRLQNWAEQNLPVVDEKGDGTARVRLLSSDGSIWQTWDAPFGEVEAWCEKAEILCNELAEDFSGEIQMVFQAESSSGTVRSMCPRRLQGRKTGKAGVAGGVFGGGQNALQSMYDAQAKTVDRLLQSANVQLEVLTRTVETQAKAHSELLDYIRVKHESEALHATLSADSKVKEIGAQLLEQAPLLIELLKMKFTNEKKPAAGGAVAAVVEQVKNTVADAVQEAAVDATQNGLRVLGEAITSKGST
jgi:hypothetical protein